MSSVADRLLEHPCVRHFLLAFDEAEWPDVVQSSAVLGIQALICRYGAAKARLVDTSCLRALARWVERQGYWPYTLPLEMALDDRPLDEIPAAQLRKTRNSKMQRPSRTPRPGRLRRSVRSLSAGRRSGTQILGSHGHSDHGQAFGASSSRRGRSAPPALGLADLVLPIRKRPRRVGAPVVSARHVEEMPSHSPQEQRSAIQQRQAAAAPLTGASAGPIMGVSEVETSEWYGRLMSRLQRLNEHLPSPAEPKLLGAAPGAGPRPPANMATDVSTAAVCRNCGNTGVDFMGNPCTCQFGQQHSARDRASAAGPTGVSTAQIRPSGGVRASLTSRSPMTDYVDYGGGLCEERPQRPGWLNHAKESPPEYEHGRLLLSELPSREGRREWHAISRGPWSAREALFDR